MADLAVIQKCVKDTKSNGHLVPPHTNVAFVEVNGDCRCSADSDHPYSSICNLKKNCLEIYLKKNGNEDIVKTVLLQLAHALDHIHENGWAHEKINIECIYMSVLEEKVVLTHVTKVPSKKVPSTVMKRKQNQDIKDLGKVFKQILTLNPAQKIQGFDSDIAEDLLKVMDQDSTDSKQILQHPYFWDDEKKLNFLSKITQFSKSEGFGKHTKDVINKKSADVFGNEGWMNKLLITDDAELDEYNKNLKDRRTDRENSSTPTNIPATRGNSKGKGKGKKRPVKSGVIKKLSENTTLYKEDELQCLLNFIRNRLEHYFEDSLAVQACFGYDNTKGFWSFFAKRFPKLFPVVYNVIREQGETQWKCSGITSLYFENVTKNHNLPKQQQQDIPILASQAEEPMEEDRPSTSAS